MIEDSIRELFWAIAKLFLSASDWMYDMLNAVVNLNLAGSNEIKYTWMFFLCFLSFATFVRVGYLLLRKSSNENEEIEAGDILRKIGNIFLVVAISVTSFFFIIQVPSEIVRIYNNVVTYDEKMIPSTAVISATAKTPITSNLNEMSSSDEVIGIDTIDEKLNDEENGEYIYFYSYSELILGTIGAFCVMCVQLNIVIDTILRLFLNIFRFCIGFIPISSLVDDNSTCGDWAKDILSDSLTMACTLIFTNVVFGIMTLSQISSLNGIIRIVFFIVGLMAVYKAGELIAKYLGASNLSSGGKAGTMLMGMGGMMATRAAMKIVSKTTKSLAGAAGNIPVEKLFSSGGGSGGSTGGSSGGNTGGSTGGSSEPSNGTNPLVASSGNEQQPENSNGYFADNGLNNQSMNDSYYNQEQGDGIIDQTPTSNLFNDKINASEKDKSYNDKNKYDSSYRLNDNSSFMSKNGTPFVDTPSHAHLFKNSNSFYKPSLREMYNYDNQEVNLS